MHLIIFYIFIQSYLIRSCLSDSGMPALFYEKQSITSMACLSICLHTGAFGNFTLLTFKRPGGVSLTCGTEACQNSIKHAILPPHAWIFAIGRRNRPYAGDISGEFQACRRNIAWLKYFKIWGDQSYTCRCLVGFSVMTSACIIL